MAVDFNACLDRRKMLHAEIQNNVLRSLNVLSVLSDSMDDLENFERQTLKRIGCLEQIMADILELLDSGAYKASGGSQ